MTEEALTAIAENAARLLADAEILYSAGSFPTATALAVLSVEEAGKYFMLKWDSDQDGPKPLQGGRLYHRVKQSVAASFPLAEVALDAFKAFLRDNAPATQDAAAAFFHDLERMGEPGFEPSPGSMMDRCVRCVAEALMEGDEYHMDARFGEVDRLKQRGFYVDISVTGEVTNSPTELDQSTAGVWLERAQAAVRRISSRPTLKNYPGKE